MTVMPMTGKHRATLISLLLFSVCCGAAEHSTDVSVRARLADASVAGETGRAASLLLRARLASRWTRQWSTLVEVDHVSSTWRDDHSDGRRLNGKPLIPDVPGTELNQLAVRYRGAENEVTLGRQRLEWDEQRFLGSDSFWQQDQTFDALALERRLLMSSRWQYLYIGRANRIFGRGRDLPEHDYPSYPETDEPPGYYPDDYSLAGEHRHDSHLTRLELNEWDYTQLVLYGLALDNRDQPSMSNDTLGARYRFSYQAHPLRYRLLLEVAGQERPELPGRPQPHYYLAELAVGYQSWEWLGRHEVLGSDQGYGFTTPIGSTYLFQGFAGVFAITPDDGLKDSSLRLNWRAHPWEVSVRHHWFSAQTDGRDYGREWNIEVQLKPARPHEIALRYADFQGSSPYLPNQRRAYLDYRYNF